MHGSWREPPAMVIPDSTEVGVGLEEGRGHAQLRAAAAAVLFLTGQSGNRVDGSPKILLIVGEDVEVLRSIAND
jgi:hypothetical protein